MKKSKEFRLAQSAPPEGMNQQDATTPEHEIASLRRRLAEAENRISDTEQALAEARTELSLLGEIATAVDEAPDFDTAIRSILSALCGFGGWEIGLIHLAEDESQRPALMTSWHVSDAEQFEPFCISTMVAGHSRELRLVRRIVENSAPVRIQPLGTDANFGRQDNAIAAGLVCAYGFPVKVGTIGSAVVELFSTQLHGNNEPLMNLIAQVSVQIGRILERYRTEDLLRRSKVDLETQVQKRTQNLADTLTQLNEQILAQQTMQQTLQVHDRALHAAANGIVISDALKADRPIIYCNPAFQKLTGYTLEEAIGHNCRFLQGPQTEPERIAELREALRHGRSINVTLKNHRKNGSVFWNRLTIDPVRDANGHITHFVGIQEDVTEQRNAVLQLREANERTESANQELARAARLKDEFLAAMSHELRTPLNAVLGLTESLQEGVYGEVNDAQIGTLSMIAESGRHLLALINDILDLSKIEAGKFELDKTEVELRATCEASMRFVKEDAQRKDLRLATVFSGENLITLIADQRRLKQMLVNLLSNAVKFTPKGGKIDLHIVGDPERQTVRFTVSDTGIGISDEHLDRLFVPFQQIDSRLSRNYGGTGLGLALVSRMAELHGGTISVTSKPGQGSHFTLELPTGCGAQKSADLAPQDSPDTTRAGLAAAVRSSSHAGAVILLVEDNPATSRMLNDYLESCDLQVLLAERGETAIELTKLYRPNLILMDVQMPGMDGLEAIHRIRHETEPGKSIPIVAITALAMSGDRERCFSAGADAYLTKPITYEALIQTIIKLLTQSAEKNVPSRA